MKIRNLYVGEIRIINDIKYIPTKGVLCDKLVTSRFVRNTLFEINNHDETKVKDIIYGGIYYLKHPDECNIGECYAAELRQQPILEKLKSYNKQNISKKKLLEYISK